jgi:hypothetical protein
VRVAKPRSTVLWRRSVRVVGEMKKSSACATIPEWLQVA